MRLLLVCISCILLATFSGAAEDALAGMCQKPFSPYCRQESYTAENGNEEPRCKLKCDVKVKQAEARLFCRSALPYFLSDVKWTNTEVTCDYKALVSCPQNTKYVGKCVKYYNQPMKYFDALKTCKDQNATFARPDNGLQLEYFSELIDPNEVVIWQMNGSAVVIWPLEYHTILPGSIIEVHLDSPLTFFCEFPGKHYYSTLKEYCATLKSIGLKVREVKGECFLQSSNLYSGMYASDAIGQMHKDCDKMTGLSARAAVTWTTGETDAIAETVQNTRALSVWIPSWGEATSCSNTAYAKAMFFIASRGRSKSYSVPESMLVLGMSCPINQSPLTDYRVLSYGVDGLLPMGLGNELPFLCKVGDDAMIKTKDCEPGWDKFVRYGGVTWCTKFVKRSGTYYYVDAQNDCYQSKARLTSIESDVELEHFVAQVNERALKPYNLNHGSVILGAYLRNECKYDQTMRGMCAPDKRFIWDDGGFVRGVHGLSHWGHNEPNNQDKGEHRLELMVSNDGSTGHLNGKLNDLNFDSSYHLGVYNVIGFFCGKVGTVDT